MNVKTILVPTDFSPDADQALSTAIELAELFGAKIVVLHAYHLDIPVVSPMAAGYMLPEGFYEDLRDCAKAQVNKVTEKVTAKGIEATGIALSEPASMAVVEQAKSLPADLIVMGTRGLSGLKHVLLGSVAERVVRTAPCPVLTVKGES